MNPQAQQIQLTGKSETELQHLLDATNAQVVLAQANAKVQEDAIANQIKNLQAYAGKIQVAIDALNVPVPVTSA